MEKDLNKHTIFQKMSATQGEKAPQLNKQTACSDINQNQNKQDNDIVQIEVEPETKIRFLAEMKKYGFTKEEDFMEALIQHAEKHLASDHEIGDSIL